MSYQLSHIDLLAAADQYMYSKYFKVLCIENSFMQINRLIIDKL